MRFLISVTVSPREAMVPLVVRVAAVGGACRRHSGKRSVSVCGSIGRSGAERRNDLRQVACYCCRLRGHRAVDFLQSGKYKKLQANPKQNPYIDPAGYKKFVADMKTMGPPPPRGGGAGRGN